MNTQPRKYMTDEKASEVLALFKVSRLRPEFVAELVAELDDCLEGSEYELYGSVSLTDQADQMKADIAAFSPGECAGCAGTGEGQYDGARCWSCNGSGEFNPAPPARRSISMGRVG